MGSRHTAFLLVNLIAALGLGRVPDAPTSQPTPTNLEDVDRARAADPDFLTRHDDHGLTVLHRAAMRGDAVILKRLLELGGDANVKTGDTGRKGEGGNAPLGMAMLGALQDAVVRGNGSRDLPKDQLALTWFERERRTRGMPDPVRGPMRFAEVTRLLLAHGAAVNAMNDEGFTPLHGAAQTGNSELVSLLIAAKAEVNAVYRSRLMAWHTPLLYATASGDLDAVRTLLDAGADPAKVPEASRGYFVTQAMRDIAIFRLLMDRGMVLPDRALAMATRAHRTEVAAEIIRREKGGDKDAALLAAVKGSRGRKLNPEEAARLVTTVRALLDAGASPSAPDSTGEALAAAASREHAGVVKLLTERGAKVDWSKLKDDELIPMRVAYFAALENRIDRLKQFEALGMPLDELGASMLGRADRLAALVAADAKGVVGEAGSTSLYFAAAYGNLDCVKILLDANADPNARVPSWDTPDIGPRPLAVAATSGHAAIVKLLLDRGADPALIAFDEDDWTKVSGEIRAMIPGARRP